MSIRTLYTCDLCKREWDPDTDKTQLWMIGITRQCYPSSWGNGFLSPELRSMICRPCLAERDIFFGEPKKPDSPPSKSDAERVLELLAEMIAIAAPPEPRP